jgi:hypothetical protein
VFIGHYGVSYAAKAQRPGIPLWVLFIAVQFLDVLWGTFVLLGIEKVRIVPGFTATNPLDLYYMPYTHSLTAALTWSVLAALAWRFWKPAAPGGFILAAAVFSHWVLDLVVHTPDLPLVGNQFKVGLGLWNHAALALLLEVVILLAGLTLYLRASTRVKSGGSAGFIIFSAAMVAIQLLVFFGAPPKSPDAAALMALFGYVLLAAVAGWLETRRASKTA